MKRFWALGLVVIAMIASSCSTAPEPGDLAQFCVFLEAGSGLTSNPSAEDLDQLVAVAPPEVRPTIETLQNRASDFDQLMAENPPNLEALFTARFDPAARREQAALATYAESNCGLVVDRPPATRWNNYVRENHANAPWLPLVTTQFEVSNDKIGTGTVSFTDTPEPLDLINQVCRAMSAFLVEDGASPGQVRVFVGEAVALDHESPDGDCELP